MLQFFVVTSNCFVLQILKERFGMVAPDVEIEDGKGRSLHVSFDLIYL